MSDEPMTIRGKSIEGIAKFLISVLVHLVTTRAGSPSSLVIPEEIVVYEGVEDLSAFFRSKYYRTYAL